MISGTRNALGVLSLAVVAAATVWVVRRTQDRPLRVLDAVPAGSFLVVTVDVDLLRESPLGPSLLGGPGSRLFADKALTTTCGFDPLERMREIAVAVPVDDDTGEFGIAIRADVTKDELVECARKVIDARGGGDKVTIRQSGSFTLIEPEGPLVRRYPTLAYREGGPFLIARGPWLSTMVDTTEGKLPSARRESKHAALRRAVGQTSDDHPAFALVTTVLLPKEMRERIKRDMGAEVAAQSGDANSAALMAGVLGVESAGLAVAPGDRKGAETRIIVDLRCEDEAACAAVARVVDKTRQDLSSNLAVRLLGVGPLFDNLTVEPGSASLHIATHAPADEVATWVERVLERKSNVEATARPRASSDEVIRPDAGPPWHAAPRGVVGEAGP